MSETLPPVPAGEICIPQAPLVILAVTDESSAAWERELHRLPYPVLFAHSAAELRGSSAHEIVVLDWNFATSAGVGSLRILRDAIVVADQFDPVIRTSLIRSGASACVLKSDTAELSAVLSREIDRCSRRLSEQLEQEEQISEEQLKLRSLTTAAFDGILVHDFKNVLEVNPACAAMFGYSADEAAGKPLSMFVPMEELAKILAAAKRGTTRFEGTGIHKDGSRFAIEMSGVAFGTCGRRVVALRDISRRKAMEAALVESEARCRELLESSHDLLCEHDLDGTILRVNLATERALGFTSEELCGRNIADLMPSSQQGDFTKYLETILRDGIADGLMVLVSKEGDRRFVHYRNSLRTTSADRPFIRGLARDVTERENALNALRRSERHFRSIIEHVSDMIVIVGQDGATTFHGPATERLLGRPGAAIDGANFRDLVHPDDGERFDGLLHPADAKQNDVRSADLRLLHGDGSWRWFSIVASSIGTPGGPTTVIMNGRDITDRRLLEAQLEQAGRLTSLGRLTATVAHEFNNVLMGMQPFADLMQRPNVPPEVVLKGAKHIANSIARGKRVALDMLRFTRPPQPAVAAVELREWWGKIAPELVAATGDLIRITSSFDEALTVTADAAQIAQVFSNLICNARDAMPRGGSIDIRGRRPARGEGFSFGLVESPERFAHIAVRDTGCGMPEDVLRHAFDPLFTTKQSGGTGLGLAVAHQVVAKHGGHIFAESEVGKGTTFHLFLPLTAETPKSEISASETDPKVQARRILIIDDEPLIGDGIAQTVAEWGMTSEVVRNGLDAVGAAKRMKPEVAVIDIWLPDVDGLTVGEELRKLDPNMKLIFASGHGDATQAVRDCYPAAFLQKPFDTRQLLETIATLERESRR